MKNENKIDKEIDKYLANDSSSLGDDFTQDFLSRINQLGLEPEPVSKIAWLLPLVSLGLAACLVSLFILTNFDTNSEVKPMLVGLNNELTEISLEEHEKLILEDLMAIPQEWYSNHTHINEETYDLLVLLDY